MKIDPEKKLTGTKELPRVSVKVNHELDKYSDTVFFPEKLARANKMLSKLKELPKTD